MDAAEVGKKKSLVLGCKRRKNRYIIQGFADRRWCCKVLDLIGDKSKKVFKKFDGSLKTVLEFKAQLIAAKSR